MRIALHSTRSLYQKLQFHFHFTSSSFYEQGCDMVESISIMHINKETQKEAKGIKDELKEKKDSIDDFGAIQ